MTRRTDKCRTLYRRCPCGETAHDYDLVPKGDCSGRYVGVWKCRNCGTPAKDRQGNVRTRELEMYKLARYQARFFAQALVNLSGCGWILPA